jgi:hypothetical protein
VRLSPRWNVQNTQESLLRDLHPLQAVRRPVEKKDYFDPSKYKEEKWREDNKKDQSET